MAKVFLSYARDDTARVRPLAQALEAAGHSVWWDTHIAGGEQFAQAIERALEDAVAVVVVWTEASCRSAWVRDEAAAGRDSNRLVPVCLDGCSPPLGFRQFQAIDLKGWNGRASAKALEPLKAAVAGKSRAAAIAGASAAAPAKGSASRLPQWFDRPRAAVAGLALVAIVAAALLFPRLGVFASSEALAAKIALGDFAVVSADLPQGMARAMRDEILSAFGRENAVAVTAAAGVTGSAAAPFVLDGSIRKDGDALRFTINLNDSRSGTSLWSRGFDRAAADPLATRQVALAASQVVRCGLWGASAYPGRMPEDALALYLQLCNEQWGGSADERRVFDAARRVTVAVPDFSFAWSALALAAVPLSQGRGAEAARARDEGLDAARKATDLDRQNPEGYMAEAGLLPIDRFAEREALLKKAISVRPTECGCERTVYGDFLASVGRMDEAVEQYQRAQAMMPLSPAASERLAHALYLSGREEEGARMVSEMLEVWPDAVSLRLVKLKSALWTGRHDEALALLEQPGLHLTTEQTAALKETFQALRSGDGAARSAAAAKLGALASDPRRNNRIVVAALAALGANDAALDAAQRLIRARGHTVADVLFDRNMAKASVTPRYAALVNQLGLIDYWKSSRSAPDVCRQGETPGFCAAA